MSKCGNNCGRKTVFEVCPTCLFGSCPSDPIKAIKGIKVKATVKRTRSK